MEERGGLHIRLHSIDGSAYPTVASISVTGLLNHVIEIAQQLAWITTSFRIPKYGQVSYSEAILERTGSMNFNINLLELEALR